MTVKLIGIDLAKSVFQLCGISVAGKVVFNRQVKRDRLIAEVRKHPEVPIAMEACFSAHYWARTFQSMGHRVLLIPPQHVKPFVRVHKSDAHDALAICEAAQRPGLHFVPVKSVEQQDLQVLHRIRQRYIRQRTQLANQLRSLAAEYGVFFPKSLNSLRRELAFSLEDAENGLSPVAREALAGMAEEIRELDKKIEAAKAKLIGLAERSKAWKRLQSIPGYGPVVAAAVLAAAGSGQQFSNGREFSAWAGLVPRQNGTGGNVRLQGITKNGDRHLRTLLIHGARAVVRWCPKRNDALARWVHEIKQRRGHNKAVVALANKCARIAWAILTSEESFALEKAFAA
jgi:transposase